LRCGGQQHAAEHGADRERDGLEQRIGMRGLERQPLAQPPHPRRPLAQEEEEDHHRDADAEERCGSTQRQIADALHERRAQLLHAGCEARFETGAALILGNLQDEMRPASEPRFLRPGRDAGDGLVAHPCLQLRPQVACFEHQLVHGGNARDNDDRQPKNGAEQRGDGRASAHAVDQAPMGGIDERRERRRPQERPRQRFEDEQEQQQDEAGDDGEADGPRASPGCRTWRQRLASGSCRGLRLRALRHFGGRRHGVCASGRRLSGFAVGFRIAVAHARLRASGLGVALQGRDMLT
jgi:hypothetical protein